MSITFKTGRTTTLTRSGTMSGENINILDLEPYPGPTPQTKVGGVSGQYLFGSIPSSGQWYATLTWGTAPGNYGPPPTGYSYFGWEVTVDDGQGHTNVGYNGVDLKVSPPPFTGVRYNWTESPTGHWSFSIDVEEWCTIYTPSASDIIDGVNFPNYGGTAEGDGLPSLGIEFFLMSKIGGTLAVAVDYGGASASVSNAITSNFLVGQYEQPTLAPGGTSLGEDFSITGTLVMDSHTVLPTRSYSNVNGGGFTDTASYSGNTLTATVNPWPANSSRTVMSINIQPPIEYDLEARLKCFTGAYPSSQQLGVNDGLGGHSVTCAPTGTYSWSQNSWSINADLSINASGPYAGKTFTESVSQTGPVYTFLSNPSSAGDDSRDWRTQMRGFKWDAMKIARSGALTIDPCTATTHWTAGSNTTLSVVSGLLTATVSGGIGSLTLAVQSAVRVWEAFRFLTLTAKANTSAMSPPATIPLTFTLAGQTWTKTIPVGSFGSAVLDLTIAGNETATKNQKSSRFPIKSTPNASPSNPTSNDPTDQYIMGWGVDYCDSISIGGIPDGYTLTLSDLQLTLSSASDKETAITLLEPFLSFNTGWTISGTSNTKVQQYCLIQTDHRVTDLGICMALITPVGAGSPSWNYYSIAQLKGLLAYLPGLTLTLLPDPTSSDSYHTSGLAAFLLGGSGSTYDFGSNMWTDWVDKDFSTGTLTIPAQDLWDELIGYPGMGQVWTETGSFNVPTPIKITKYMRCQAWGEAYKTANVPYPSQSIKTFPVASPSTNTGTAITGALGEYATGSPYGQGNVNTRTELFTSGTIPYEDYTWMNRLRERSSFRIPGTTTVNSPICAWSRPNAWGYVATSDTSNVYINRYITSPDANFTAESFAADALAGCWIQEAQDRQYLFYVKHGETAVKYQTSYGLESTWTNELTITNGTQVASAYSKEASMCMVAVFYASGGPGTNGDWQAWTSVKGSTFVNAGTIVSGVPESSGALNYEPGAINQFRFTYVDASGVVQTHVSQNGGVAWT